MDNSLLLIQAVLHHQGLGLVPRVMVDRDLAAGTVLPVLTGYPPTARTLRAVYPNRQYLPRRVSMLVAYLRSRFKETLEAL